MSIVAHTTLAALVEHIRWEPRADLPRLVLADWYEERGDEPRARFIRLHTQHFRARGRGRTSYIREIETLFKRHAPEWAAEIVPPGEGVWEYRTLCVRASETDWHGSVLPVCLEPEDSERYFYAPGVGLGFRQGLAVFASCLPRVWEAVGEDTLARHPIVRFGVIGEIPVEDGLLRWVQANRRSLSRVREFSPPGRTTRALRPAIRALLPGVRVRFTY